jgi:hypothetical protein
VIDNRPRAGIDSRRCHQSIRAGAQGSFRQLATAAITLAHKEPGPPKGKRYLTWLCFFSRAKHYRRLMTLLQRDSRARRRMA